MEAEASALCVGSLTMADWVGLFIASLSFVAALSSAICAVFTLSISREVNRDRRLQLLRKHVVDSLDSLIISYANLLHSTNEIWSDERRGKLEHHINDIRHHIGILRALEPELGIKIHDWYIEKSDHNSLSIIFSTLSRNMIVGKDITDFMENRNTILQSIHRAYISSGGEKT